MTTQPTDEPMDMSAFEDAAPEVPDLEGMAAEADPVDEVPGPVAGLDMNVQDGEVA